MIDETAELQTLINNTPFNGSLTLDVNSCTFPAQPGRGMRFIKTEGTCSNIVVSNTKLANAVDVAHPTSGAVLEYGNSVGDGPTVLPL